MLHFAAITLPLEDPILKFLLILIIIFAAPLILNRLKIPHLLGLIVAGAVVGEYGFNLMHRDSSIILSGTAGLLYIMFLSGLEMDISDFKQNSKKSIIFGVLTFLIPLGFGYATGYYLLHLSTFASLLLGALFASQTLIAYPIVSKLGIARNRAVTISVGGTIITDTLSLLLLTVVVGLVAGDVGSGFAWRLSLSVVACVAVILFLFPIIAHWFFKRVSDSVSQYIFVLAMVFLGSYFAQLANLKPIIGAFLAGLAFSRLIPKSSPLMSRIDFIGNAIFIPFFLISVGMMIDYRAFIYDFDSLKVGLIMTLMIVISKWIAAYITQKSFRLTPDERTLIFGLSAAHVAAALVIVMAGYELTIGTTADGHPIRLFDESILNGTILTILASCIISTFATQRGAHRIALSKSPSQSAEPKIKRERHTLIPIASQRYADELVALSVMLKKPKHKRGLYALHTINNQVEDEGSEQRAEKVLHHAAEAAAGAGCYLEPLMRYDVNIANAIVSVVREQSITEIVMGIHRNRDGQSSKLDIGAMAMDVVEQSNVTTFFYKPSQPLQTIKRHLVIVPNRAEAEAGFKEWLYRVRNVATNSGAKLIFFASKQTLEHLRTTGKNIPQSIEYREFEGWEDIPALEHEIGGDDAIWFVMSRHDRLSFHPSMTRIMNSIESHFSSQSFVLLYPIQASGSDNRYI